MTLPDGSSQQNTYNKAGLLETVSSNGQAYVTNINYNEKGQRTEIVFGNATETKYFYEAKTFRLMQLLTTRNSDVQNPLQDLRYTYDPVGNIVEIYDASKETSYYNNTAIEPRHLYTYDALYRLLSGSGRELLGLAQATSGGYASNSIGVADTRALHTYTQHFAYDELGNIQSIQHQTPTSALNWTRNYVYDSATNRLLKHDENQTLPDYTYDEHGNMLSMPHLQSMHYDHLNQLNKVVLDASGNTAYYIYDAGGQRVRKVVEKGYVREERIYVGGYEVFRKYENSTLDLERATVHIMDDKNRVALIEKLKVYEGETVSGSEQIRYQYSNHLGSASLELNATGQIISYEEYHPFGTTSYRSGSNETEVSLKRYKYIGKERDEETGLYYYGARYYAAWIGRFVSVDPLAEKYLNLSPYAYVANNPIKYIDPDGRKAVIAILKNETGGGIINVSSNIFIDPQKLPKGITLEQAQAFANNMNEKLCSDLAAKGQYVDKNNKIWEISVSVTFIVETPSAKDSAISNYLTLDTIGAYYSNGNVQIPRNIFKQISNNNFKNYSTAREESVHTLGFGDRYDVVGKSDITGKMMYFGILPISGWEKDILTGSAVKDDAMFDPKHFDDIGFYFESRGLFEMLKENEQYIRESFTDKFDRVEPRGTVRQMLDYNELSGEEQKSVIKKF